MYLETEKIKLDVVKLIQRYQNFEEIWKILNFSSSPIIITLIFYRTNLYMSIADIYSQLKTVFAILSRRDGDTAFLSRYTPEKALERTGD